MYTLTVYKSSYLSFDITSSDFDTLLQNTQNNDVQALMSHPISIINYLEKFSDSFSEHVMEYFMDNDDEKFKDALHSFDISVQEFINYISYVFDVTKENVKIFTT